MSSRQLPGVSGRPDSSVFRPQSSETTNPSFQVLLERLHERARKLETASGDVAGTENLADAVSDARESLAEAISLGSELLEAYRETLHQPGQSAQAGETAEGAEPEEPAT